MGPRIRNGKLAEVVKNPNYRGISATFWRSSRVVGDAATVEVLGTPFCGKGEPNQVIRVGHARRRACSAASMCSGGALSHERPLLRTRRAMRSGARAGDEFLLANFSAEVSDFVRFNHARVRQAMTIQQAHLTLTLIEGNRHASVRFTLSADSATDTAMVDEVLAELRADLPTLPEDPYLLYSTAVNSSELIRAGTLPRGADASTP